MYYHLGQPVVRYNTKSHFLQDRNMRRWETTGIYHLVNRRSILIRHWRYGRYQLGL